MTALLLVLAVTAALLGATPANAVVPAPDGLPQTPRVDTTPQVVDLTFPVADPEDQVTFIDDFLYLRGGGSRLHAATDLMTPKHRAVHAAVGGTITFAPDPEPSYGWMLSIRGDDGRRYAYVHLNNDTPVRDADGRWLDDDAGGIDHAYAPRIVDAIRTQGTARGLRVERGELIGWVGDSGNAKGVAPHLHFEIHVEDAHGEYRINPYHSLVDALGRGDVPGAGAGSAPEKAPAEVSTGADGDGDTGYADVSADGVHTPAIERLTGSGVVTGCTADQYCPYTPVTRGDLARFLAGSIGLTAGGDDLGFSDVDPSDENAAAIATVTAVGVLNGYDDHHFGPDDPLSRAQLATVLVQGFGLPAVTEPAPFVDVLPTNVHAANIAAAFAAELTQGCGDGERYCGDDPVTRGQIASFLDAAMAATG